MCVVPATGESEDELMRIVYAVESESYGDDYRVHELFESRADAEAWIVSARAVGTVWFSDHYEIVERELWADGEVAEVSPVVLFQAAWTSAMDSPRVDSMPVPMRARDARPRCVEVDGRVVVHAFGETQEKALKACLDYGYQIAAELRGLT